MRAAGFNQFNAVKTLTKNEVSINLQDNKGWSALMWAAAYGHHEVATFLMNQGADLSINSKARKYSLFHRSIPKKR